MINSLANQIMLAIGRGAITTQAKPKAHAPRSPHDRDRTHPDISAGYKPSTQATSIGNRRNGHRHGLYTEGTLCTPACCRP